MTKVTIKSYDDLMTFINRNDINYDNALKVVQNYLRVAVFTGSEHTKEELIKDVALYIDRFGDDEIKPIFLHQSGKEFKITDVYETKG